MKVTGFYLLVLLPMIVMVFSAVLMFSTANALPVSYDSVVAATLFVP